MVWLIRIYPWCFIRSKITEVFLFRFRSNVTNSDIAETKNPNESPHRVARRPIETRSFVRRETAHISFSDSFARHLLPRTRAENEKYYLGQMSFRRIAVRCRNERTQQQRSKSAETTVVRTGVSILYSIRSAVQITRFILTICSLSLYIYNV